LQDGGGLLDRRLGPLEVEGAAASDDADLQGLGQAVDMLVERSAQPCQPAVVERREVLAEEQGGSTRVVRRGPAAASVGGMRRRRRLCREPGIASRAGAPAPAQGGTGPTQSRAMNRGRTGGWSRLHAGIGAWCRGVRAALARLFVLVALGVGGIGAAAAADIPTATPTAAAVPDDRGVIRLDVAWTVVSNEPTFPLLERPTPVTLPREWPFDTPAGQRSAWFRLGFELSSVDGLAEAGHGILLRRACGRLTVRVNGLTVHADAPDLASTDQGCYRPRLVPVPRSLLRAAGNVLDLKLEAPALREVTARQRAGGLAAVEVGPLGELEQRYERLRTWQVTSVQVAGLTLAVLAGLVATMGWLNRRDPAFVYFALMALTWAAVTLRVWVPSGLPSPFWKQWLLASAYAPVAAFATLFLLRQADLRRAWVDRAVVAMALLVPAALFMAGPRHAFVAASAGYAILAAQVAAAAVWSLAELRRQQREDFAVMAVLLGAAGVLVVVEFAIQAGRVALPAIQVGALGLSLLIVLMAFRLANGLAEALARAEVGRAQMQDRVAEVTAEIERNFAQLAELRVEQVTEKERKRIAADLHDDLGAKLLTIVHTSESERISTLAREALEEMRLSVRGLTGKPVRVADALADWRVETVGRLSQAGIEADWRSPAEEGEQRLAARTYVQTTRILREATSNIIKHSGSSFVKVRCAIGAEDFVLVIQDNGKGISTEMSGKLDRGQGMYSMKNRAKQMQGQCLVESGPGYGTVIRLTLPLNDRTTATAAAS
jgi:signal transduction histidine kinase